MVATGPLLETKLRVPRPRRSLVARARLRARLNAGSESALTLVSAPAGFGKSTLVTEWLAAAATDESAHAWLSLDERDNDPLLFWTYVTAALQTAIPGVGAGAQSFLASPSASIDAVLATLLNDLHGLAREVVLVLDDYHVIDAPEVHEGMAYLLEHVPHHVHLVIASRSDPPLPLARLRARGELVEIRAADLRFTTDEAAAYLNEMMGLELTTSDVAALEARTEGWIVALQLAALSMQDRDDIAGFIAGFAGDDRFIVDYLAGEVLQRQPEPVRSFLIETSILSRLNGGLCDAVTGSEGGKAMLEALDRRNLFVVALDDRRHWYRYHHLFADVLRARLLDERPDRVHELHRSASEWYAHNGEAAEAIRHAMEGADFERAADLVEMAAGPLRRTRQEATLRRWIEALPEVVFDDRPVLAIARVGVHMVNGEIEGVEATLLDIERRFDSPTMTERGASDPSPAPVVVDHDEFRRIPNQIATYRAGLALLAGDADGTVVHAQRALELAAADDHLGRGAPAALLALAHWNHGDLGAAHRWYADALASLSRAGNHSDVLGLSIALADILITQGRLNEAANTYERGLALAAGHAPQVLRGVADMHVGMSEILRERNELDAALDHLRTCSELAEHAALPQNAYRSRVAQARIRQAQGDLDGADDLLGEAERVYTGDYSPEVRPVAAMRARVHVAQGRLDRALDWTRERQLAATDALTYLREFEHITLARVLLARRADEATSLLERLLAAAEEGGRTGSVIEILVLTALANQTGGDLPAALAALERALTRAGPECYVRTFLDEGPPMTALLRAAAQREAAGEYARRVLASEQAPAGPAVQRGLVEPLSERELDVLRLLRSDLSGPDIARELTVSLNTMRTHTKSIYSKLGVNSRRAAVRRADDLGL